MSASQEAQLVASLLERAGAYRVYDDPADLLRHLDEVGVRLESTT